MSVDIQIKLVIGFLIFGIYLGIMWDLCRELFFKKVKFFWLTHIITMLFWIIQALIFYEVIYGINNYILPIYTPFLILGGVYTYIKLMREKLLHTTQQINILINKLSKVFLKILYFTTVDIIIDIYNIIGKRILNLIYTNYIKLKEIFIDAVLMIKSIVKKKR